MSSARVRSGLLSTRTLLALVAGLVWLSTATAAMADGPEPGTPRDSIFWNNPAGGAWTEASNWSPANVPDTPWEAAVFKPLTGAYAVTLDATYNIGGLRVDGGTSLVINAATLRIDGIPLNRGTIRIENSGTLRCYYPLFQNRGGTVVAGSGGGNFTVCGPYVESPGTIDCTLYGTNTTRGGVIASDGGDLAVFCGTIVNGNIQRFSGTKAVNIQSAATQDMIIDAGAEVCVTGHISNLCTGCSITNNGTLRVQGHVLLGATNLTGTGELILEGGKLLISNGASLMHTAGHTIRGCGTIEGTVVNDGDIEIDCPYGSFNLGTLINNKRITVRNGLAEIKGAETVVTNAGLLSIEGGTMWIHRGATLDNRYGILHAERGTIEMGGFGTSGTIFGGKVTGSSRGMIANFGTATLRDVTLGPGSRFFTAPSAHTIATGIQLTSFGTNRIAAQGTFTVAGGTRYVQGSGATVLEGGTLTVPSGLEIAARASLRGFGMVEGNVTSHGTVSPEVGPASLRIAGDYHQLADARLDIGLAGPGQVGRLEVTGDAFLDGSIEAAAINGYDPAAGSRFQVISAATLTGQFDVCEGSNFQSQLNLVPLYHADGLVLGLEGVVGVENPLGAPAALRFFGRPLAGNASFVLELPREAVVTVRAYDVSGREIATLVEGAQPAGVHTLPLDGARTLPAGIYLARASVQSGGQVETLTARVLVVK